MARVGRERERETTSQSDIRGGDLKGRVRKEKEEEELGPKKVEDRTGGRKKKKASDFKHVLFSSARRTGGGGGRKYNKRAPFLPFLQQRNNLAYSHTPAATLVLSLPLKLPPSPPFASIPRGTVSHLPPPPLCLSLSLFCMSFLFL